MIRNALRGLLATLLVVLVIFFALGFRLRDLTDLFAVPYRDALTAGLYLDLPPLRIPGSTVAGEYTFRVTIRNPTRTPLKLDARWERTADAPTVEPMALEATVPPGGEQTVTTRMVVERPVPLGSFQAPVLKGEWLWAGFAQPGQTPSEERFPLKRPLQVLRSFGRANMLVLAGYFALMLLVGLLAGRQIKGTKSYFIADGRMNYIVAGLSIFGTYLSALTMMGLPGMSYGKHDWTYTVQLPFLLLTAMVITGVVLPRYREAGIVSIYEYLEQRIDVSARMVASICFIIFAVGRTGLVLYLPALALATVTGIPLWVCIVAMGAVVTIYTVIGGIEAVMWTDAIQVVIFVAGALLTLGFVFRAITVDQFVSVGLEYNKFRVVVSGYDPTKIVTLWLILETIFQTIRIYGTQQDMAQRYLTTDSTERANRSVWISILAYIPVGFLFYFIGTALFVFYKVHPDSRLPEKSDSIYPYFVVQNLPPGVAGLLIAAMFAAAMSSIDSCMNSSSTVWIEDFVKRFSKRQRSDREYLGMARRLTLVWGVLGTGMALLFMGTEYAQIGWGKLMGVATNGMLGLMALAFLPFRVSKWAAGAGLAFSFACLFLMMGTGVNFLLWPVFGNLACFLVALFLNPLFAGREGRT